MNNTIKRGIVAFALVSAGALAFSGCNAASIAEDVAPIAAGDSPLPEMHEPIEEEYGDEAPAPDDSKIAVAGKETYTYDDGLAISIGNIKKTSAGEYSDHPGAAAVQVRRADHQQQPVPAGLGPVRRDAELRPGRA